jgi:hypothetical protein
MKGQNKKANVQSLNGAYEIMMSQGCGSAKETAKKLQSRPHGTVVELAVRTRMWRLSYALT